MSKYFVNMTTALDIVRNDEIATLRTSLVRLCDGNFCAALILDDFYYRAYANQIYRYPHEVYDRSLVTDFTELQAMMSDLFGYRDIQIALFMLSSKKKYVAVEIDYNNDYITYEVNLERINRDLELLPGNKRDPEPKPIVAPTPAPIIEPQQKNSNPTRRESRAVKFHNNRASAVALAATLTLQQWQKTLEDFENKCAYCRVNEYQVLEHYIPLNFGGGTTAYNCVPACVSCNGTKSDQHPSMITSSEKFIEALKRVQAYLETRRSEGM